MPEVGYHHIGADILLPRGDHMKRGQIVVQSHDDSGNVMDKVHINPMVDTRMYQVEFINGEVTELTANVMAESIYA